MIPQLRKSPKTFFGPLSTVIDFMSNIESGLKQPSSYCLIYLSKRLPWDLCPYVLVLNYRCRRHLSEDLGIVRKKPNYFGYEISKMSKGDRELTSMMGRGTLSLELSLENWDPHCKIFPSNMIQFKYSNFSFKFVFSLGIGLAFWD